MVLTAVAEVISTIYDDDAQKIFMVTFLKNVTEVDPPEQDSFPGTAVGGVRWVRRISETFQGEELEVHSTLTVDFSPGDTTLFLEDVSRLPNSGSIFINRGSSTEENLPYTGRDLANQRLTGVSTPVNSHFVGEKAFATVDIDFLGKFEIDLRPFGLDDLRRPATRHGTLNVTLNDVVPLRENIDFTVVNEFVGKVCTRSLLRFELGEQPNRFNNGDVLQVEYDFIVQDIGSVVINAAFGETSLVNVFETQEYGIAFDVLQEADREVLSRGNISITPPFSSDTSAPSPVKIVIPNVRLPEDVTIVEDISPADNGSTVAVSDVTNLPDAGTLINTTDDAANRKITIEGDEIFYDDLDTVNNRLVGVTGIDTAHSSDTEVIFDGARFIRDVVKDAINKSDVKSQVDAISLDVGGRHLILRHKVSPGSFNLQPGTYKLFFVGFNDATDRGLHEEVTTTTPFENKELTFDRYTRIINRQLIAENLLGQTTSRRTEVSPSNPRDPHPDIP